MKYAERSSARKRITASYSLKGTHRYFGAPQTYRATLNAYQFTWSEAHDVRLLQSGNAGRIDIGGNFATAKTSFLNPGHFAKRHILGNAGDPNSLNWYDGNLSFVDPAAFSSTYDQSVSKDMTFEAFKALNIMAGATKTSDLNVLGATAISRCSPTKQYADLLVSLRELQQDGLPSVPGLSRARIKHSLDDFHRKKKDGLIKGSADEYLNVVFGWTPLLADIGKFYNSVKNFDKLRAQFERDAGRVVRRSYHFPRIRSTNQDSYTPVTQGWPTSYWADSAGLIRTGWDTHKPTAGQITVERRHQYFSGAFTYHINTSDSIVGRMSAEVQKLNQVLGIGLTPENIWNATPWTWLVDWFVNAGDVISNYSDMLTDGLVLRYGYIMEHVVRDTDRWFLGAKFPASNIPIFDTPVMFRREYKQRVRATPFGFGLTESGLSAKQKLILAALGITRV